MNKDKGFTLVEIIVALGIFVTIAATGITTVVGSFTTNRLGDEETKAWFFSQEGIEGVRSIKKQGWSNLTTGTHGLVTTNGYWELSGSSTAQDQFTRMVDITDVYRNGSGDIVESGGTLDPDTLKVTSTVNWSVTPGRSNTVILYNYLSNWTKIIVGDWSAPTQQSSLDIAGIQNGINIVLVGSYAYIIRSGGTPTFLIVDVSNPASPSLVGGTTLTGIPTDLAVSGSYAFVTNSTDSQELQVIDISNPALPAQITSLNFTGGANATAIAISGNYAYVTRNASAENEFVVIDISTPTTPSVATSLNLTTENNNDIYISGSYAYVASSENTQEIRIINISNPLAPSWPASFSVAGNDNALCLTGFGNTLIVGRQTNGDIHTLDITNPIAPSVLGTVNTSDNVNNLALGNNNTYLFAATDFNTTELQIFDISTLATPTLLGSLNLSDDINGIVYDSTTDRVIAVGENDTQELIIFQPQ